MNTRYVRDCGINMLGRRGRDDVEESLLSAPSPVGNDRQGGLSYFALKQRPLPAW